MSQTTFKLTFEKTDNKNLVSTKKVIEISSTAWYVILVALLMVCATLEIDFSKFIEIVSPFIDLISSISKALIESQFLLL